MNTYTIAKKTMLTLFALGMPACGHIQPINQRGKPVALAQQKQLPSRESGLRFQAFQSKKRYNHVLSQYLPVPTKGMKWTYRLNNWDTRIKHFKRYSEEIISLEVLDVSHGKTKAIIRGWDDQVFQVSSDMFWREVLSRLSWDYFDGPFKNRLYCPGITNFWCEKKVSVPSGTFNSRQILSSNMPNPESWTPHMPLKKAGDVLIQLDVNSTIGLVKFKERSRGNQEWLWLLELINYSEPMTQTLRF